MRSDEEQMRRLLLWAHEELVENCLVAGTSGNVSGRMSDAVLIKPSGVPYPELTRACFVRVELSGISEGPFLPSTDTESHLIIYRDLPGVGAVVHTHSQIATAFAAQGMDIPCMLTAQADHFGGDIPCSTRYAEIGGQEIGHQVVEMYDKTRSRAFLLMGHGVITLGMTVRQAVTNAIMIEDIARTMLAAQRLGPLSRLPQTVIDACWDRFQNRYGQPGGSYGS